MNTIVISPKSILCELQPVSIEEKQIEDLAKEMDKQEVLNVINMDINRTLDMHQRSRLTSLLQQHIDIFSKDDSDIGSCNRIKHRIDLLPGFETPFKQPHRRIPPPMVDEVRKHLEQLLDAGIIRKS